MRTCRSVRLSVVPRVNGISDNQMTLVPCRSESVAAHPANPNCSNQDDEIKQWSPIVNVV